MEPQTQFPTEGSKMGNVTSVPKQAPLLDEMRWRCKVCNREMAYSQPISIVQQCLLLGAFIEGHEQCGQLKPGEDDE